MFVLSLVKNVEVPESCDICRRLCDRYYSLEGINKYYLPEEERKYCMVICCDCIGKKWHDRNGYIKYDKYPTTIDKNVMLIPIKHYNLCHVCHTNGYDHISIFIHGVDRYTFVCKSCIHNSLNKCMYRIMNDCDHPREMLETINSYTGHIKHQNIFDYLNDNEKNKIMCERSNIKNLLELPSILCDIVISYYCIFER
jgi:hypothetical protein